MGETDGASARANASAIPELPPGLRFRRLEPADFSKGVNAPAPKIAVSWRGVGHFQASGPRERGVPISAPLSSEGWAGPPKREGAVRAAAVWLLLQERVGACDGSPEVLLPLNPSPSACPAFSQFLAPSLLPDMIPLLTPAPPFPPCAPYRNPGFP